MVSTKFACSACRVVVASLLRAHVAATERVFRQCVVEGVRVPSHVNRQPLGHEETLRGASNRLDAAKAARPGADYYVAIESGVSEVYVPAASSHSAQMAAPAADVRCFDTGWVLLERSAAAGGAGTCFRAAAPSAGVELPAQDVYAARERGFERGTAAMVVAERAGLLDDAEGVHAWLTAGRRGTEALLAEAMTIALGQLERCCRSALASAPSPPVAASTVHPPSALGGAGRAA